MALFHRLGGQMVTLHASCRGSLRVQIPAAQMLHKRANVSPSIHHIQVAVLSWCYDAEMDSRHCKLVAPFGKYNERFLIWLGYIFDLLMLLFS